VGGLTRGRSSMTFDLFPLLALPFSGTGATETEKTFPSVGGRAQCGAADEPFSTACFSARAFQLFTFNTTFYFCQIRSALRENNLRGRATTNSGSGYDKFRVGYDKFRVWVRQIQGLGTTNSGSGYDKFRVGYDKFRVPALCTRRCISCAAGDKARLQAVVESFRNRKRLHAIIAIHI
jgi:hypothetical protein